MLYIALVINAFDGFQIQIRDGYNFFVRLLICNGQGFERVQPAYYRIYF